MICALMHLARFGARDSRRIEPRSLAAGDDMKG